MMMNATYRRLRRWAWLIGAVFFAHLLKAQKLAPGTYQISEAAVVRVLQANGLEADGSAVHLPGPLSASMESPSLEIVSTAPLGADRARIELRCRRPGECIPFFITLDPPAAQRALRASSLHLRPLDGAAGSRGSSSVQSVGPLAGPRGPLARMQAGSQVTIVLADARMRIEFPGIAMDTGTPGAELRVCTLDRKTVFHVYVVDSATARGTIR